MGSLSGTNGKDKRQRSGKQKASGGWGDYEFVDLVLTPHEKEVFSAEYLQSEIVLEVHFRDWVESGYKVSASSDTRGGGVLVTLTCRAEGDVNKGLILTARASELLVAFRLLVYIDVVLCGEDGWKQKAAERGVLSQYDF